MWQPCRSLVTLFMMYDPETPPLAPWYQIVCANGFVRSRRDDSLSPQLSWSACRCHPAWHQSTSRQICLIATMEIFYLKELTDPEAKSTRIMIVGVLGLNMVLLCIYCISLFKNISIFKYSLHFRTFTFTLHLQCNTTLSPLFVKDWTNLQRSKS